jgi:hypothetical protein
MTNDEIMNNTMATTSDYLTRSIQTIDELHGAGFAMENPQILAAFIQSAITLRGWQNITSKLDYVANSMQLSRR